jgi:protein associated with RNAse G/E
VRKIRVISKKYDNSFRERYETCLYSEGDGTILLFSPPATKHYDYRKQAWLEAPDGLVEIYFKDRWYNVWHICEQKSNRNKIYSNICMPAALEGNVLEWVDLDLDFRVRMDGSIELLDEEEFEQNARQFGYPGWVVENAKAACGEVVKLFGRAEFPFDHSRQIERYQRIQRTLKAAGSGASQ